MKLNTSLDLFTDCLRPGRGNFKTCLSVLISLFVLSLAAFAQETTGGIQGTVKDPQGAVIKGATIEVNSPSLIGTKTATTDSPVTYHFYQLPPDLYTIPSPAHSLTPHL